MARREGLWQFTLLALAMLINTTTNFKLSSFEHLDDKLIRTREAELCQYCPDLEKSLVFNARRGGSLKLDIERLDTGTGTRGSSRRALQTCSLLIFSSHTASFPIDTSRS